MAMALASASDCFHAEAMRGLRLLLVAVFVALAGCANAPMPQGNGRGLIAFDPTPPSGAKTYQRPALRVGDRYTLLRGGQVKQDFSIVQADEHGVVMQDTAGHQLRRDTELGYLGEWDADGRPVHLMAPVDVRFHWPLWVGKRWRCEYIDKRPGVAAMTLEVSYHVEGLDKVTVPAGTFETLRIARVAGLEVAGATYYDRTSFSWYAPAIGIDVRHLLGDTAFELVDWSAADQR